MRRRLTFLEVSLVAALVAAVLYSLRATAADLDLWGHLAFGRLFWEAGRFPYRDVFSWASTVPWVNYEWLTGVVFYPLYQAAGPAGLQLLRYGLGLGLLLFLFRTARLQGASVLATVLVLPLEEAQPGWEQLLRAYAPDLVLVNTRARIYPALLKQPEWQVLYRDAGAALFGRAAEFGRRGVAEKTTKEGK